MKNIFTLLILSVCFLCANISGRAQNKFSDMEVNHVRVATPGLFSKENCVMLDLKSLSRNYSFPLPGGKVISGYGTRGGQKLHESYRGHKFLCRHRYDLHVFHSPK